MTGADYRAARVAARMTQLDVARAVGVHKNTVARRERDELPVTAEAAAALLFAIEHRAQGEPPG